MTGTYLFYSQKSLRVLSYYNFDMSLGHALMDVFPDIGFERAKFM